jgi:hypothetical protein
LCVRDEGIALWYNCALRRGVIQVAGVGQFPSSSMRCSNCGFENLNGRKFCSECGDRDRALLETHSELEERASGKGLADPNADWKRGANPASAPLVLNCRASVYLTASDRK